MAETEDGGLGEDGSAILEAMMALQAACTPLVLAYLKRDRIADSDLDDAQPVPLSVTLGDLRTAGRAFRKCKAMINLVGDALEATTLAHAGAR